MKQRSTQLGVRKSPDSPRVHGLRPALSGPSNAERKELQNGEETPLSNVPHGATAEKRQESGRLLTVEEVAALLHVPVSWVYGRMRERSLERLPAYRLGKYWRFRENEIRDWVERQCRGGRSA